MRVPPALMWWEVRTVSPVPATLDTLEMESPVWVSELYTLRLTVLAAGVRVAKCFLFPFRNQC